MLQRHVVRQTRNLLATGDVCIFCDARKFAHFSLRRYATLRKSQSTRDKEWRAKGWVLSPQEQARRKALEQVNNNPRREILQSANKAGFMKLSADEALKVLEEFKRLGKTPKDQAVRELCEDHSITLSDLVPLARILLRSENVAQRALGRRLLISLSAAGDVSATLRLVNAGLRQSQLWATELKPALAHLHTLATRDKEPSAMVLQGRILEKEGKKNEALALYEAATKKAAATAAAEAKTKRGVASDMLGITFERSEEDLKMSTHLLDPDDAPIIGAWIALGKLRLLRGDAEGARKAFEVGAFQGDDPAAYFLLAEFEARHSSKWLEYVTKAAASGHPGAAYELGMFYSMPRSQVDKLADADAKKAILSTGGSTWFGIGAEKARMAWAVQWLGIAMSLGHSAGALALPKLYWAMGMRQHAMQALEHVIEGRLLGLKTEASREAERLVLQWDAETKKTDPKYRKTAVGAEEME